MAGSSPASTRNSSSVFASQRAASLLYDLCAKGSSHPRELKAAGHANSSSVSSSPRDQVSRQPPHPTLSRAALGLRLEESVAPNLGRQVQHVLDEETQSF